MIAATGVAAGPAGVTRAANIARTLVIIPPGFQHVKSPADQ